MVRRRDVGPTAPNNTSTGENILQSNAISSSSNRISDKVLVKVYRLCEMAWFDRDAVAQAFPNHNLSEYDSVLHIKVPSTYRIHLYNNPRPTENYPDQPQPVVDNIGLLEQSISHTGSTRNAIFTVAIVFLTSLTALAWIYMSFPQLEEDEKVYMKLPWDIEDAKNLGRVLDRYKDRYYLEVLALVFITYIFLNTFAIPGSISLSILSGFLFPFPLALTLVCFCTATGASLCYLLSSVLGRKLVYKYLPEKAAKWAATVNKHREDILNYILFLRMTPFLPNWFINIASPCIDVPLFPFWLGTFIGVAPPSFLAIQAGQTLHQLSANNASWSWTSVGLLGFFATLSLVPVFFKNKLRRKFE